MKDFTGNVLFLDRANINTDEIIPAKYLTEITKEALRPHLLEDLCLEGFIPGESTRDKRVIITRANFGCGSSREHAPWALEANGINVVIAPSFARIFRQNMFNCGLLALKLPETRIDRLFDTFAVRPTRLVMDLENSVFTLSSGQRQERCPFEIAPFDRALVAAGGWVEYADQHY